MASTNPTGKAILRASLALFRQDRQMIWLPVMATVTGVVAFAVVAVPLGLAIGHTGLAFLVAFACGSLVATAATVIFNVALVFAANDRIEGRTPTINDVTGPGLGTQGRDLPLGDSRGRRRHDHPHARGEARGRGPDRRLCRRVGLGRRHLPRDPRPGLRGRRPD